MLKEALLPFSTSLIALSHMFKIHSLQAAESVIKRPWNLSPKMLKNVFNGH